MKSNGDEATDFHDKEFPKVGSNHTWLAVINVDSVLKKTWQLLSQSVFKRDKLWKCLSEGSNFREKIWKHFVW